MSLNKESSFSFDNVFNEKTEFVQYTLDTYNRIYNLPTIKYEGDVSDELFAYVQKRNFFVLLVIYDGSGRIFLERNLQEQLYWSLPGGSILKNEDIHTAVRRISERIQTDGNKMILGEIEPIAFIKNKFNCQDNSFVHHGIAFTARIRNFKEINCDESLGAFIHPTDQEIDKINRYANQQVVKLVLSRLKFFDTPFPEIEVATNENCAWRYFIHNKFVKKFILTSRIKKRSEFLDKIKNLIGEAGSFIDVSCGDSDIINSVNNEKFNYLVANDISWSQIKSIQSNDKKIIFTNHNATYLPFKENSFAVAYCANTLHHMSSKKELLKLLDSIFRVAEKLIIVEIEKPNNSGLIPYFLHKYWYAGFLKDVGGAYLSRQDFYSIISSHFEKNASIKFDNFSNIQGNYLIAEISKKKKSDLSTRKIIEVEAKYICKDILALIKECQKKGFILQKDLLEKDEYFTDINGQFVKDRTCLRLRSNNDKLELTFKGKSQVPSNFYLKEEHNIILDIRQYNDYQEMINSLGYHNYVEVKKKRRVYLKQEVDFAIAVVLDELQNIGSFVEFEISYIRGQNSHSEDDFVNIFDKIVDEFKVCGLTPADEPYRDYVAKFYANNILNKDKLSTILFDFDGTIAPSEQIFFDAYKKTATEFFGQQISIDDYRKFELDQEGWLFDHLSAGSINGNRIFGKETFMEAVYLEYENLLVKIFNNNSLFLNLHGIEMLKKKGYKLGLVSSSKRKYIDLILNNLNQNGLFDVIIAREDVDNLKPTPDPYLLAMDKLAVKADECLAVEDSNKGIMAATQAKINCVSVRKDSIYEEYNNSKYGDRSFASVLQICLILLYAD